MYKWAYNEYGKVMCAYPASLCGHLWYFIANTMEDCVQAVIHAHTFSKIKYSTVFQYQRAIKRIRLANLAQ